MTQLLPAARQRPPFTVRDAEAAQSAVPGAEQPASLAPLPHSLTPPPSSHTRGSLLFPPAADYNGTTTLFTSRDSGATFTPTYSQFPEWNVPLFGLATPPPGAAAAGDVWAFAGWKLYHSTNAGVNFSQVWQVYSLDRALAVGPLPAVPGGRSAGELALACAARAQAAQAGQAGASSRPLPPRLPSGAAPAYAVYVVGPKDYEREGLYGSVDFGATWIPLAGANSSTPLQGLGDTPYVLEASLQQPGVLLVGTEGRGGYVRNCTEDLVRALLACGQ